MKKKRRGMPPAEKAALQSCLAESAAAEASALQAQMGAVQAQLAAATGGGGGGGGGKFKDAAVRQRCSRLNTSA